MPWQRPRRSLAHTRLRVEQFALRQASGICPRLRSIAWQSVDLGAHHRFVCMCCLLDRQPRSSGRALVNLLCTKVTSTATRGHFRSQSKIPTGMSGLKMLCASSLAAFAAVSACWWYRVATVLLIDLCRVCLHQCGRRGYPYRPSRDEGKDAR